MKHGKNNSRLLKIEFLLLMSIWGCLGPIVRAIGLPSPVIACLRAWISAVGLILFMILSHHKIDRSELKQIFVPMILSGILLSTDWIGLFLSYNYTTIATATVCYYIAPIVVFLASPIVLKEHFRLKHLVCALVAFLGMICVSGVLSNGLGSTDLRGPLLAVFGAVSYAGIILINKRFPSKDSILRTSLQLMIAALLMTPYILLTEDVGSLHVTVTGVLLLLVLGLGMTAIAYIFYFSMILKLPARTVGIFSYADPMASILISIFFLGEPIGIFGIIGTILIIGSAIVSETRET